MARGQYLELDGEGARLYGGRWNSSGHPVLYTARTLSQAALEVLVHIDPEDVPDDLFATGVEIAGSALGRCVAHPERNERSGEPESPRGAPASDCAHGAVHLRPPDFSAQVRRPGVEVQPASAPGNGLVNRVEASMRGDRIPARMDGRGFT